MQPAKNYPAPRAARWSKISRFQFCADRRRRAPPTAGRQPAVVAVPEPTDMLLPVLLHGLIAVFSTAAASTPWPLPPPAAMAPVVVPQHPAPDWSWDTLPTSMHGADKMRAYNESEIERLAKYSMVTLEKCQLHLASILALCLFNDVLPA